DPIGVEGAELAGRPRGSGAELGVVADAPQPDQLPEAAKLARGVVERGLDVVEDKRQAGRVGEDLGPESDLESLDGPGVLEFGAGLEDLQLGHVVEVLAEGLTETVVASGRPRGGPGPGWRLAPDALGPVVTCSHGGSSGSRRLTAAAPTREARERASQARQGDHGPTTPR